MSASTEETVQNTPNKEPETEPEKVLDGSEPKNEGDEVPKKLVCKCV